MNIFVAFFVLLLLLAESTPKAAESVPLIGRCFHMYMYVMSCWKFWFHVPPPNIPYNWFFSAGANFCDIYSFLRCIHDLQIHDYKKFFHENIVKMLCFFKKNDISVNDSEFNIYGSYFSLFTGTYFCLSMIMITLSTILAVIITNMFFRGVRINRAPAWLRTVSHNWQVHLKQP